MRAQLFKFVAVAALIYGATTSIAIDSSEMEDATAGEDNAERTFAGFNIKTSFTSDENKLHSALARLEKQAIPDAFFKNAARQTYLKTIAKQPESLNSAIVSLTNKFGDKRVAELIEAVKKVPETDIYALQLEEALMKHWLDRGDTPNDVLLLLELEHAEPNPFLHPLFPYLINFVKRFKVAHPDSKASFIQSLADLHGDLRAVKLFKAAVANTGLSSDINALLGEEQLNYWLVNKMTPDYVYQLLGLKQVGKDLLARGVFNYWSSYVERYNLEYNTAMSRIDLLIAEDKGGEVGLANIIEFAKKKEDLMTKKNGIEVEKELFDHWMGEGKSPEQVFELLGLSAAGNNLLTHALFRLWKRYRKSFSMEHGMQTSVTEFLISKVRDGEVGLANIIELAKEKTDLMTKLNAIIAEDELFNHWLGKRMTPKQVLELLRLKQDEKNPLVHKLFRLWSAYVTRYNVKHTGEKSMVELLIAEDKDGEVGLVNMIQLAKKQDMTKNNAIEVEEELLKYWLGKRMTPDSVLELLRLKQDGKNLLVHPLFPCWSTYVGRFKVARRDPEISVVKYLADIYGEKGLAELFKAADGNEHFTTISEVNELFGLLGLKSGGDGLFTNPLFIYWRNCLKNYNKANPTQKSS